MNRSTLAWFSAALLLGCSTPSPHDDGGADTVTDDANDAGDAARDDGTSMSPACNPIGFGDPCVGPFPSAYYEVEDGTRASGYHLALPTEALPLARGTTPLDATPFNRADGFSAAGPILMAFSERIDSATLVPVTDIGRSLDASSSTVLLDMTTGERVPHFAEIDAATMSSALRQSVIIRPAIRLHPAHRYAVAFTDAVHAVGGGAPTMPPGFAAVRDGATSSDPRLATVSARYPAIFDALATAGVTREHLLVAWDFVTASEDTLTGEMLAMRDAALTMVGNDGLGMTVTQVDDNFDASISRRIQGTFRVPLFLDDPSATNAQLVRDADGHPMITRVVEVPFVAMIPRLAETSGPLPMLQFGHGIFGSAVSEFGDASSPLGHLQQVANQDGFVIFATDWIGLTQTDLQNVTAALGNFNLMAHTTERLHQALINAMVLYRTARGRFAADAAFTVNGHVAVDPTHVYFYGISAGAIMGASFMGYDPDCTRATLNVFGGVWSTLFQRNDGWAVLRLGLTAYPRTTEQQVLLALAQSLFDPVDPINLAPHLLADRLPGVPPRVLLFQQAKDDSAVTNIASEMVARTAGLTLTTPSPRVPWGATQGMAPLESGWTIIDEMPTPPPPLANLPAPSNPTHTHMRTVPSVREQFHRFMREGGMVEQTCDGACDPN